MSMLMPLLLSGLWAGLDRPYHVVDPSPALAPFSHDYILPDVFDRFKWDDRSMILDFYYPLWMNHLLHRGDGGTIDIKTRDGNFTVMMDVWRYELDEISVKVVDRCIVVEAKHKEKVGEHDILRECVRKYLLPERADAEQVSATLFSDRVLVVTTSMAKEPIERTIEIELTGRPFNDDSGTEKNRDQSTTSIAEENEIREEVTTQAQENVAKPEK